MASFNRLDIQREGCLEYKLNMELEKEEGKHYGCCSSWIHMTQH